MSKIGGFFTRKAGLYDKADETEAPTHQALPAKADADAPLGVDEELFAALGAQTGSENEQLRSLLINASAKIGELDTIKDSVGKLVGPISKALRTLEAEKAEKIGLQTILNNTRAAYGKLRNEAAELEKSAAASEEHCQTLRLELASTQAALRTAEATKADIAIDIGARKAQIADLEARLAHESGEAKMLREETRRHNERLTVADKHIVTLESDLNATRQRLVMTEDERRALQTSLDKVSAESARLARKLTESEALHAAMQGRLRHVEANLAEATTEKSRLASALDEANEKREHEAMTQSMRFETLQARAYASEKLLVEAREHLIARAEEIRDYERRNADLTMERDTLQARLTDIEAERIQRESELYEIDQVRTTLIERSTALTRAFAAKESALARAEEAIATLNERLQAMDTQRTGDRHTFEQAIEELTAALHREKMERAMVEGALESARQELARQMRELMALQRRELTAEDPARLVAANAA